ncbi:hypothetical protein GGTG_07234 [Gaeumannomyces tritici R3-111a-1]|uniref:Glycosyl hydrolase n=1 Tax=Gaeumannomyces tritici (strain R3-111a-1) TaxID=644352 RepID=J3P137_GAET3|nr:hypothetical protein GGTG_07234 [Gaeumannomyces tritici R3-111a-1]EJT77322.1 hypothetical protein GGTG_07234 [Gaeumannomyces tritici R3-111a-1]
MRQIIFAKLLLTAWADLAGLAAAAPAAQQRQQHPARGDTGAIARETPKSAIDRLNGGYYNEAQGLWSPSDPWWLTGNALHSVLDYMDATGSREYLALARNTIDRNKGVLPSWPQGAGLFRAASTDDTAWWALALTRMYDVTGELQYLDIAVLDFEYLGGHWDASACGGGVIQELAPGREPYKNAISNALYVKLAASLAVRDPSDPQYLQRATEGWEWFRRSGMINADGLVNDGIDAACRNNGQMTWTYNQGAVIGALVELSRASGDGAYLEPARAVADAVMRSPELMRGDGVLKESCEVDRGDFCNADQSSFKGIFARNLAELDRALDGNPYRDFLRKNAQVASGPGRDGDSNYGLRWAGPFVGTSMSAQSSAVGLLVAAL